MKKSIITEILYGNRGQKETMKPPLAKHDFDVQYEVLQKNLTPEQFALHQKFVDDLEDNWSDDVDFFFAEGFKLGILIGIECAED